MRLAPTYSGSIRHILSYAQKHEVIMSKSLCVSASSIITLAALIFDMKAVRKKTHFCECSAANVVADAYVPCNAMLSRSRESQIYPLLNPY